MRTVVSIAVLAAASLAFAFQDPPKQDPPTTEPPKTDPAKQDPPVDPAKQDPTPVDPSTLKQDPVKITGTVETWYKVTQERQISQNQSQLEQIGYAHERIYKSGPSKYGYFFETDFDYLPPGEGAVDVEHVNIQVTGELEEDFDPFKLKVNCSYGTRTTFIEVRSSSDKRYVEFRTSEGVQSPIEVDPSDSLMLFDGITLFRLRQKGLLSKTDVKVAALSGAGAEPVEVSVIAGKAEVRDFLGKKDTLVHPVKLSSDLFGGEYAIDRYGRVLERKGFLLMGANEVMELKGLKITASPDSKDAKGENSGLSQRGRRDPFYKMGVMTPVKGTRTGPRGPLKPGDQGPVIPKEEQLPQEIAKVEELIKALRKAMAENNEPEAKKLYFKFLQNYKLLREMEQVQANPNWVTTLDSQKAEAEKIYGGADKLLAQADAILDQIAGYLEALALEKIEASIKQMEKFRDSLELYNETERQLTLEKKIRDAGARKAQCVARRELRDKKIVLTGVVLANESVRDDLKLDLWIGGVNVKCDEPVRVQRSVSYAVVNDEYYREGDVVKGEGVRVDKIYRQGIAISYKDEVLEVPLRKR
jgi:hypothetical protein